MEHVFAKIRGIGIKDPPLIQGRHPADEAAQEDGIIQHKGVDGDALLGHIPHFPQGHLQGAHGGRVLEPDFPVLDVGRRLAIRDDDNLLVGAAVLGQQLLRQHQGVLEVGAVLVAVLPDIEEVFFLKLPGKLREADDVQPVLGELAPDEGIEGDGCALGGFEVIPHKHRQAHIQHQDDGCAGGGVPLVHLEVIHAQI